MTKMSRDDKCHLLTKRDIIFLSRDDIVSNTKVLHMQNDIFRLLIHEAMLIKFQNPSLNRQAWIQAYDVNIIIIININYFT